MHSPLTRSWLIKYFIYLEGQDEAEKLQASCPLSSNSPTATLRSKPQQSSLLFFKLMLMNTCTCKKLLTLNYQYFKDVLILTVVIITTTVIISNKCVGSSGDW
uniref:Uncharacterized protein n=1 Tax=Glossina palpalis gambiensis TaxID=67801 RepID=A0A1B0BV42_9MUSC